MRGTRLTRAQKILVDAAGLNPANYLCIREEGAVLVLLNRMRGEVEYLAKFERRKRR